MTSITFTSANASVDIKSYIESLVDDLTNPEHQRTIEKMIPSVSRNVGGTQVTRPEILVSPGQKFDVSEVYPSYMISGQGVSYLDVVALTEHLLERGRQEGGVYNLHSSVVGLDDRCVVLHGASKCGKTLLSLELSQSYGLRFLSNERALINLRESSLVGGCKALDLSNYHQEKFPNLRGKKELVLGEITSPKKIISIIQPIIDSGAYSPQVISVSIQDAEWALYPEFTGRIRGDNRRLRGDSKQSLTYPLDSLDTKDLSIERMKALQLFLSKTPVYFVRGSLPAISQFVLEKLR